MTVPVQTETETDTTGPTFEDFAKLYRQKRALESRLRGVKSQIRELEEPLMERMSEAGVRTVTLTSGETIYLHRQAFAGVKRAGEKPTPEERRRAIEVLESLGMQDCVTLNYQTLSAYCREHDELLPELEDVLALEERYSLRVRKG